MALGLKIQPYISQEGPGNPEFVGPQTELIIHIDGSCQPNPGGPMYAGIVLLHREVVLHTERTFCGNNGTNNKAEFHAFVRCTQVIKALQTQYPEYCLPITIVSDSQIAVNCITGKSSTQNEELKSLCERFKQAEIQLNPKPAVMWVPRKYNQKADKLSKAATPSGLLNQERQLMEGS